MVAAVVRGASDRACFGAAGGGAGAGASLRERLPARRGAAASPSLSSSSVRVISVTDFASRAAFAFATNLFRGDVSRPFFVLG
jgi:hypothetical protein